MTLDTTTRVWDMTFHGYGKANLVDGVNTNGMVYTFDCQLHFMKSDPGEAIRRSGGSRARAWRCWLASWARTRLRPASCR